MHLLRLSRRLAPWFPLYRSSVSTTDHGGDAGVISWQTEPANGSYGAKQPLNGTMARRPQRTRLQVAERRESMKRVLLSLLVMAMSFSASYALDNKPDETPQPKIKVGDTAPDFTLTDQNGNKVSLHDFKGKKNVALAFYIFAFTGG